MAYETDLLQRVVSDPKVFGGKPSIRGKRLAVEHVMGMLAAGDSTQDILTAYPRLEAADVQACILYAYKLVARERIELFPADSAA